MTRGHFNIIMVLQICTDPLQVLPGSSCETFPSTSDAKHYIGNINLEEDLDIKELEKIYVKAEVICSDDEECIGIKDEEGIHSKEEEEEDMDMEEKVSCEDTV
jgi:hypothetical protein